MTVLSWKNQMLATVKSVNPNKSPCENGRLMFFILHFSIIIPPFHYSDHQTHERCAYRLSRR
jgi:hypothetical protein